MNSLYRTLLDDHLESDLVEKGWVTLPLLDESEVEALRSFYTGASAGGVNNPEGAYDPTYAEFSVIHSSPSFREEAYRRIVATVATKAAPLLNSFRPLVANFVNKPAGSGLVPIHQNWAVVDETRFRSVSVWVALVDCNADNGALEMLPKSHSQFRDPRGMWAYESFGHQLDDVRPSLERIDVRAGDAIILDDAIIHYSAPNVTQTDRLAIQLIMVPEAATPYFFQRTSSVDGQMSVNVWEVDDNRFFWDFWHGDGDAAYGHVVSEITLPVPSYDLQSLIAGPAA